MAKEKRTFETAFTTYVERAVIGIAAFYFESRTATWDILAL